MTAAGRPPARGASALAQSEAQRGTLNYALGNIGGRQKPWMTPGAPISPDHNRNPPAATRKPGRPPKPRANQQLQTPALASPSVEAHRERHPASNPTSPYLANVVALQTNGSHVISPPAVPLPSPSPSEEALMDQVSTPPNRNLNTLPSNAAPRESAASNDLVPPRDASPNVRIAGEVPHAAAAPKRPAETELPHTEKRSRMEMSMREARPVPAPLRTQLTYHQNDPRRTSLGQAQHASPSPVAYQHPSDQRRIFSGQTQHAALSEQLDRFAPSGVPPQSQVQYLQSPTIQDISSQSRGQPRAGTTPPQTQAPFGLPGSETAQHSLVAPPTVSSQNPQITQPTGDWYTQQDCMLELGRFEAVRPHNHLDRARIEVLEAAVSQRDWAYLTMHQYYSLITADPQALPASVRNHPILPFAVRLMREVLDKNDALSPAALHFFANFPRPLEVLCSIWPRRYEQEVATFHKFIEGSVNYGSLKTDYLQRGIPPLVRELVHDLGIHSTTFQQAAFTAVLRELRAQFGILPQHKGHLEKHAIGILRQNQADFQRREASRPVNQVQSFDSELQERNQELRQWGTLLKAQWQNYPCAVKPSRQAVATAPQPAQQTRQPPVHNSSVQAPMVRPPNQAAPAHSAQAAIQRGRGRPRVHPPAQPAPSYPSLSHAPPTQLVRPAAGRPRPRNPLTAPLLARPGVNQPQQRQPNPARFALHQALLRSPVLQAQSPHSPLYQFVKGFLKPPVRLTDGAHKIKKWTFPLTREDLELVPKGTVSGVGAPLTRIVDEKSHGLRLRCLKWTSTSLMDEHSWATADTSFIPQSYFTFNGTALQQRKKLHYGKDQPIDITNLVKEGENTLEIAILRQRDDDAYLQYLVAIEIIGIRSHASIMGQVNHVSAATTLQQIKEKLSSSTNDDEIAVVESKLTINLFDPFSASKVCDIPARGKACLHYDCFDLETFLQTRKRKGDVSVADQWRCPICNGDARPQHLIVDGFLEEVRDKLAQHGLLHTRAIIISQDGSWTPKAEVVTQERKSPDDEPVRPSRQASTPHAEVIDLSD